MPSPSSSFSYPSSSSSSSLYSSNLMFLLLFSVFFLLFFPLPSCLCASPSDLSSARRLLMSRTLLRAHPPSSSASPSKDRLHKPVPTFTSSALPVPSSSIGRMKPNLAVYNYAGGTSMEMLREQQQPQQWSNNDTGEELLAKGQMLATVPDLSDPCFRRYANSIIVNAQPFERRSSISLINCKVQCLRSPVGLYSCRSFVYDNLNQVCDLFAHVGDQSPAKLLLFKTRDYFEPTAAIHCAIDENGNPRGTAAAIPFAAAAMTQSPAPPASVTVSRSPLSFANGAIATAFPHFATSVQPSSVAPASATLEQSEEEEEEEQEEEQEQNQELATISNKREEDEQGKKRNGAAEPKREQQHQQMDKECSATQLPRFLRTTDFELFGFDETRVGNVRGVEECANSCNNKRAPNGMSIKCHSFEFTAVRSECTFAAELAVPLGNGQLRQKAGTDYFERICVDKQLANKCQPSVVPGFRRFPQMILVGFAETVVDSPTLQECFDNCLNSRQLYGFICSSGMFYFEEPQLNCILNTEDRSSQPELFTTEASDLVDYFETGCSGGGNRTNGGAKGKRHREQQGRRSGGPMPKQEDFVAPKRGGQDESIMPKKVMVMGSSSASFPPSPLSSSSSLVPSFAVPLPSFVSSAGAIWTGWTRCTGKSRWTTIGTQMRQRICGGARLCGKEERQCNLARTGKRQREGNEGMKRSQGPNGESRRRDYDVFSSVGGGRRHSQRNQRQNAPTTPFHWR